MTGMDNKLFRDLLLAGTLVLGATTVRAQMTLDFSDVETTTQQLSNGATLVEFPLDVNLSTVMAGVSVSVDGVAVDNEDITPNPAELALEDDQVVVLSYGGKAYQFHFSVGRYFTAIILSDPHIEHSGHDATTVANMRAYVDAMVAMGQSGTRFQFDAFPELIPTCDIALSLGDMDADSKTDSGQFTYAHSGFNAAGIPFITLLGNHDVVPDYWTGTDPDKGLTLGSSGGSTCNDVAIATVQAEADTAQLNGIEDYQIITDGTSHTQVNPFTFTFRGVRFYCGQTYWFQKPYEKPTILTYLAGTTTYYAPDGVIDSLEAFVDEHAEEPSVWLQHYPFVAGSDCNRWWLDQNDYGLYIQTTDSSEYGTSDEVDIYTASSAIAVATKKKDKLASIINKTTNPVHFSGHTHVYATNTYQGITDYTVAATGYEAGAAYIALMKGGKGVLEVRKAYFNSALNASRDDIEQAILDASTEDNRTAALLERLPQSLTQLNDTTQDSLLTAAIESGSVADMNSAFAAYRAQSLPTETIDVTALIGDNTGFEEAQGELVSPFAHVYPQTGWNEHYSYFSTEGNVAYYYAQQSSEVDTGSDGEACLYLRSRWQDQTCREQVMRQTALPAGDYTLTFSMKAAGTMTDNLCFVQVGTEQTAYTPTTAWVQYAQDITLEEPTLLTLSFGFTGGQGSTETALYVDDIALTTPGTYVETPEDDNTGEEVAIGAVTKDDAGQAPVIFSMSGQRWQGAQNALPRGVYIIDGKKTMIE